MPPQRLQRASRGYLAASTNGEKRTSRLGANISFIKANLCPLSFIDVPPQAYIDGLIGVYEHRRVALLRDVFLWAYERSRAQYHVVRSALGEPDPFRLRYRTELSRVVRETVQQGAAPQRAALRQWAPTYGITRTDVDPFAETALGLLLGLHEGSAARYGLRPTEFTAWKAHFAHK